ncbi:MAG: radical SAM protein [Deltaproteobacteria bacterium]|nr:radical SAM protein [Deltaproteobacteria bacterium]
MSLVVNEIFYSIQGESIETGMPCVFVRLTGCNLRCAYCDTRYAYDEGSATSIDEIVRQVLSYGVGLVEITGGEPLIQEKTPALAAKLLKTGLEVMVETNGSMDIDLIDRRCIRVMDIKCPSSNEASENNLENLDRLTEKDRLKFVISDRNDYCFAKIFIRNKLKTAPVCPVLFSPVSGGLDPAVLAEWILADRLNVRLQVQLHRILWPDKERGV